MSSLSSKENGFVWILTFASSPCDLMALKRISSNLLRGEIHWCRSPLGWSQRVKVARWSARSASGHVANRSIFSWMSRGYHAELAHGNRKTRKHGLRPGVGDVTGDSGGFEEIGCILVMAGHSVRVCGDEGEDDADPCFVRDSGGRGSANRMGDFRRAPRESGRGGVAQRERESCAEHSLSA